MRAKRALFAQTAQLLQGGTDAPDKYQRDDWVRLLLTQEGRLSTHMQITPQYNKYTRKERKGGGGWATNGMLKRAPKMPCSGWKPSAWRMREGERRSAAPVDGTPGANGGPRAAQRPPHASSRATFRRLANRGVRGMFASGIRGHMEGPILSSFALHR